MQSKLSIVVSLVFCSILFLAITESVGSDEPKGELTLKTMKSNSEQILNTLGMLHKSRDVQVLVQEIDRMENLSNQEPSTEEWPEIRRVEAELWLFILQAARKEIDADYNFDTPPELSIAPLGPYPSGIAPESIKEPEIRKEYEKAIAKNKEKAKEYNFQYKLREMERSLSRKVEDFLVNVYSKAPQSTDQLMTILEQYAVDEETTAKILRRIRGLE